MAALGVATNTHWAGDGDTKLAIDPVQSHGAHEDVVARKEALLERLSDEERDRRQRFLALLTEWLAGMRGEETHERRAG